MDYFRRKALEAYNNHGLVTKITYNPFTNEYVYHFQLKNFQNYNFHQICKNFGIEAVDQAFNKAYDYYHFV